MVDRSLVARVEPGLPAEVNGFPLRIRVTAGPASLRPSTQRAAGVGAAAHGSGPSRVERLADQAMRATTRAATRAAQVVEVRFDCTAGEEHAVADDAFVPPDRFEPCASYDEFVRKTGGTGSGGGGFDFD